MSIDASKILKKVRGTEPEKGRISLYFDLELWKEFQKHCQDLSASKVVEELVREFLNSVTNKTIDSVEPETPGASLSEPKPSEIDDIVSLFSSLDENKRRKALKLVSSFARGARTASLDGPRKKIK